MPDTDITKQRTNVTLSLQNLKAARRLGLNVSSISDAALAEAVRKADAEAWTKENARAIEARKEWIDRNGAPLVGLQVLNTD